MPDLIDLPEGYTVRENRQVGVDYLDPSGNIVLQHPVDSNAARRYMWIHKEKVRLLAERLAEIQEDIRNA